METLLLSDALYVHERYEELELERRRHSGHSTQHHRDAAGSHRDLQTTRRAVSSTGRDGEDHDDDDALARVREIDATWPSTLQEKRLSVMEASLHELAALTRRAFEEAEKIADEEDSSVASPVEILKSLDPALLVDETTPRSLEDLPMASQLSLKMFFRLCTSLRSSGHANGRLLGMMASKIPAMLENLPPLCLSPGVIDRSQAFDAGEQSSHSPTLSVFQELLAIYGELLDVSEQPNDSKNEARQMGDIDQADKANAVMAYVALSLKWGRLRDLVQAMLLLTQNPDILSLQQITQLRKLLSELASAQAETPSQPLLPQDSSPVGILVSFGKGDHGKLGHGQCTHATCSEGNCTENKNVPTVIASTRDVKFAKIDSLSTHSIAITTKGEVMAWGNGDKYRLGHGTTSKEYAPRIIDSLSLKGKVTDVACGLGHTIALMATGDIYAWGNGSNGRLGLGDANDRASPMKVPVPDESALRSNSTAFRYVMCGASHSLALTSDGRAFTWGKNNQGQCGHGHTNDQLVVAEVKHFREELGERITHASGGWEHTLFCSASGRVYSCGCGYKDSRRTGIPPVLGHGDCEKRQKPSVIQSLVDANEEIVRVSCGWDHSLAVSAEGGLYTWGSGTNGKLGHGDEENCEVPTLVRSLNGKTVKDAKAGCEHTVALTSDHEVWTFGQGDSGRLGLGDAITRKSPTMVEFFGQSGLRPVAIAVGDKYNLVLAEDAGLSSRQVAEVSPAKSLSPSKFRHGHISRHGDMTSSSRPRRHLSVVEAFKRKEIYGYSVKDGSLDLILQPTVSEDESSLVDQATVVRWIASHVARISSGYLQQLGDSDGFHTLISRTSTNLLRFGVDASSVTLRRLLELIALVRGQGLQSSPAADRSDLPMITLCCLRLLTVNIRYWTQSPGSTKRSEDHDALFDRVRELASSFATDGGRNLFSDDESGRSPSDRIRQVDAAIREEAALILKVGFALLFPTRGARVKLLWDLISSDELRATKQPLRAQALAAKLSEDSIMGDIVRSYFERSMAHECDVFSEERGIIGKSSLLQNTKAALVACFSIATKQLEELNQSPKQETLILLQLLGVLQGHVFVTVFCCAQHADTPRGTKAANWEVGPACDCAITWLLTYIGELFDSTVKLLKALGEVGRPRNVVSEDQAINSILGMLLLPAIQATCAIVGSVRCEGRGASPLDDDKILQFIEGILPRVKSMLITTDALDRQMKRSENLDEVSPSWIMELSDECALLYGRLASMLIRPSAPFITESELLILMGPSQEIQPVNPDQSSGSMAAIMPDVEHNQDPTRDEELAEDREYLMHCLENQARLETAVLAIESYRESKSTSSQTRFESNTPLRQLRNCGFVLIAWFAGMSTGLRKGIVFDSSACPPSIPSKTIAQALSTYESILTTEGCAAVDECGALERARQLLGFKSTHFQNLSSPSSLQQWVRVLRDCLIGTPPLANLEGCLLEHIRRPRLTEIGITTFTEVLQQVSSPMIKNVLLQQLFSATVAVTPQRLPPVTRSASFANAIDNLGQCLVSAISTGDINTIATSKALGVWLWILRNDLLDSSQLPEIIARSGLIVQLGRLLAQDPTLHQHECLRDEPIVRPRPLPVKEKQQWAQRLQPVEALMTKGRSERYLASVAFEVFASAVERLGISSNSHEEVHVLLRPPAMQSVGDAAKSPGSCPPRGQTAPTQRPDISASESTKLCYDFLVESLQRAVKKYEETLNVLSPLNRGERREQEYSQATAAFLLASPLSISIARSHILKTLRIPSAPQNQFHPPIHAVSLWMHLDETQATTSSPSASRSLHLTNVVTLGCMTDRLHESAAFTGSNQAIEVESTDRMRLVVFAAADESNEGRYRIGYSVDVAIDGTPAPQWLTVLSEDGFQHRQWLHIAVSVDELKSVLYVNGKLCPCRQLPTELARAGNCMPSGLSLGQLSARTQVVCGGSLSGAFQELLGITTLQPNEQPSASLSPPQDPITGISALIDDLWVYTTPIDAVSARVLHDQEPTFLHVKHEFDVEQNLLRNLRLLHKLLSVTPLDTTPIPVVTANVSEIINSLIEILLRVVQQCRRESAYEAALLATEVLKRLLAWPHCRQPTRHTLESVIACLQPGRASSVDLRTHLTKLYALGSRAGIQSGAVVASQAAMNGLFAQHGITKSETSGPHNSTCHDPMFRGCDAVEASIIHLLQTLLASSMWRPFFLQLLDETAVQLQDRSPTDDGPTNSAVVSILISAGHSELFMNNLKLSFVTKAPTLKAMRWADLNAAWTTVPSIIQEGDSQWSTIMRKFCLQLLGEAHRFFLVADAGKSRGKTTLSGDSRQLRILELQVKALRTMAYHAMTRGETDRAWHASLLGDSTATAALLDLCVMPVSGIVRHKLGPDATQALKLRSVRYLLASLAGWKARSNGRHNLRVQDEIEVLAWELTSRLGHQQQRFKEGIPDIELPAPWRQHSSRPSLLEALGGDVLIRDLTVQAVQHFPTVRLGRVAISANSGLWYYEVQVLTDGLMQVGYVDSEFVADAVQGQGVGDQANSWAFDGYRCKKWNVSSVEYGEPWQAGDLVGVLLDTDRMELSYFLNRKFLGIAFANLPLMATTMMHPAVSLNADQRVRFNFGRHDDGSPLCTQELLQLPALQSPLDQKRLQPVVFAMQDAPEELAEIETTSIFEDEQDTSDGDGDRDVVVDNGDASDEEIDANDQAIDVREPLSGKFPAETISIYHRDERTQSHHLPGAMEDSYSTDSSSILPNPRVGSHDPHRGESEDDDQDNGRSHDDESGNRQATLIDGLVNLGFPRSWAVRCAQETSFTSNDTGAVSWILEQMEKEATSSVLRSHSDVSRYGDGGLDKPSWESSTALAPRRAQHDLSLVTSTTSVVGGGRRMIPLSLSPTRDGRPHTEQQTRNRDLNLSPERPRPTNAVSRREQPLHANPFLSSEMDDDEDDDLEVEEGDALKLTSVSTHQCYTTAVEKSLRQELFGSNEGDSSKSKDELTQRGPARSAVDEEDLVPACVVAQSVLGLCYTRLIAQSVLFDEISDAGLVYPVVVQWITKSRADLCCFLRTQLQLHVRELPAVASRADASSQATRLGRGIMKLLKCETSLRSDTNELPLLQMFLKEVRSQTTKAARVVTRFRLARSSRQEESPSKIIALTMNARWTLWIFTMVQQSLSSASSITAPTCPSGEMYLDVVTTFLSPRFIEDLTKLAASSSGVYLPWRTAAFHLLKISMEIHTLTQGAGNAATVPSCLVPLEYLVERLAQMLCKDLTRSSSLSVVTTALWEIALKHVPPPTPTPQQTTPGTLMRLHMEQLAPTYATISWTCPEEVAPKTTGTLEGDEDKASPPTPLTSSHLSLEIVPTSDRIPRVSSTSSSTWHQSSLLAGIPHLLPPSGSLVLRHLAPDSSYIIRLVKSATLENHADASELDSTLSEATTVDVCETQIRTPLEQVFELSSEACGKNLMLSNRNRTVKNLVNKKWNTVRASVAFDEGVHHWHVRIDSCVSKNIFIGICTADASLDNYIGSDPYGYGFLANKAVWHNKSKLQSYGEIFKQGDLIQVALDCNARTLAYSRNGEFLGVAATNLHVGGSSADAGGSGHSDHMWYPAVSLYNKDDQLTIIVPPSTSSSTAVASRQRPQFSSVMELVDSARLAISFSALCPSPSTADAAFEIWRKWKNAELCWREMALCNIIQIDASCDSVTSVFDLGPGDTIFTSRGHCVVLGVAKHELWYEVLDGPDNNGGGKALCVGSWSLRTCREMLASPEDYPVHRARRLPAVSETAAEDEVEVNCEAAKSISEGSTSQQTTTGSDTMKEAFLEAQHKLSSEKLDVGLLTLVDALVGHRGLSSPHQLTFADVSSALVLHDMVDTFREAITGPDIQLLQQDDLLMRLAVLFDINQHAYGVIRLFLAPNSGSTTQWQHSLSLLCNSTPSEEDPRSLLQAAAGLAASIGVPWDTVSLPSSVGDQGETVVRRWDVLRSLCALLFASQREKLISEAVRRTATPTLTPSSTDSKASDLGAEDAAQSEPKDMLRIQIQPAAGTSGGNLEPPFWEHEATQVRVWLIPRTKERRAATRFMQLSKQIASASPHELRREFIALGDASGISRTFHVVQTESGDTIHAQDVSIDQASQYLKLLDDVFMEIQSPAFPLFVPVASPPAASKCEDWDALPQRPQLDVNAHLVLPEYASRSEIRVDEALLWFFQVGQLFGVVWRSRSLVPLQFFTLNFWETLLKDGDDQDSSALALSAEERLRNGRAMAIRAVRDGLCSIIPYECLQLSSPESLRSRLSDTDVFAIERLHQYAIFDPDASHHRSFWKVVRSFSSLERRVLIQFLRGKASAPTGSVDDWSDDPIETWKRRMLSVESPPREELTLELADPLPDALAHPDACFPVVDVIQPHASRLHLPEYSSAAVLRQKLVFAMHHQLPSY